jgi:hypothetical protein
MATVTVTMFGDKEIEVPDDEIAGLRSQGILTSVNGEKEDAAAAVADENVMPAAELQSAGAPEKAAAAPAKEAKPSGGEAPAK